MATIALALGAAVVWGTSDFVGGLQSRKLHALTLVLWVNGIGVVLAGAAAFASGATLGDGGLAWALASGVVSGIGFVFFYAALGAGTMSVVAPITAAGAVIPVVVAFAQGESVRLYVFVGIVLALGGAVLASRASAAASVPAGAPVDGGAAAAAATPAGGMPREALVLAVLAAIAIGSVLTCMQQATAQPDTDPLAVVATARGVALVITWLIAFARRVPRTIPRAEAAPVAAVAVGDTSANVLFTLASSAGSDAVAAVLSSLYPVTTVVLARSVLSERLSRAQAIGIGLALAGVVLVSAR